jgi:hypothetical protein
MTDGLQAGINSSDYHCSCGRIFKFRQGLHKHKIKCSKPSIVDNPVINVAIVLDLIKQNKELQELLVQQASETKTILVQQASETKTILAQQAKEHSELINKLVEREPTNNTINSNSNNTTNNNQKFNLNFFLNETCKDAMNIQEFIDNIRITFEDLLTIGNGGFVNGVSDILIKQLRDLEVTKRPIHCTDSKRETIYLKEEAAWNKDDKEKTKLKQIIEKIEYKNVAALHNWCNENPDAKVNNTPNNVLKDKIFFQTLQGDERTRDKIIKNLTREVVVEKENPLIIGFSEFSY